MNDIKATFWCQKAFTYILKYILDDIGFKHTRYLRSYEFVKKAVCGPILPTTNSKKNHRALMVNNLDLQIRVAIYCLNLSVGD